jgi:hypothetical protein
MLVCTKSGACGTRRSIRLQSQLAGRTTAFCATLGLLPRSKCQYIAVLGCGCACQAARACIRKTHGDKSALEATHPIRRLIACLVLPKGHSTSLLPGCGDKTSLLTSHSGATPACIHCCAGLPSATHCVFAKHCASWCIASLQAFGAAIFCSLASECRARGRKLSSAGTCTKGTPHTRTLVKPRIALPGL